MRFLKKTDFNHFLNISSANLAQKTLKIKKSKHENENLKKGTIFIRNFFRTQHFGPIAMAFSYLIVRKIIFYLNFDLISLKNSIF